VVEREGMIIACAALYPIADSEAGELACLAVNPEYRHGGRGRRAAGAHRDRVRGAGVEDLVRAHDPDRALVPRAWLCALWRGTLPAARASLYNFQRNSKIFEKSL
jgi:amino-acid N-acetyltransferase